MSNVCEEIGHDYSPRHEKKYAIPEMESSELGDFPPVLLIFAVLFLAISTIFAIKASVINVLMFIPILMFLVASGIYYDSRFNKVYVYDICKRCGKTVGK